MVTLRKGPLPALIVPVTQNSPEAAMDFIHQAVEHDEIDFIELRIDFLTQALDASVLVPFLKEAVQALKGKGSILTFRTAAEGGATAISSEQYVALYGALLAELQPSFIDVEFNRGKEVVADVIRQSRQHNVPVIISSHDFQRTETESSLVERMESMRQTGADVVKIATMPNTLHDVLALLGATATLRDRYPQLPLITMSMGRLGVLSRLTGEIFGSDATFGMIGHASAPGQIDAVCLSGFLDSVHEVWAAE